MEKEDFDKLNYSKSIDIYTYHGYKHTSSDYHILFEHDNKPENECDICNRLATDTISISTTHDIENTDSKWCQICIECIIRHSRIKNSEVERILSTRDKY